MKFNSCSARDRKERRLWKKDSPNPGFLVMVERIGSHLEMMLAEPKGKGVTPERFTIILHRLAPHADEAKVASIVRELMYVWTFAPRLPSAVKEMQYHGMCVVTFPQS